MPDDRMVPAGRLRLWHGLAAFFVALGVQAILVAGLVLAQAAGLLGPDPEAARAALFGPIPIVIQVTFTSGLLALIAVVVARRLGAGSSLGLAIPRAPTVVLASVGVLPVGVLVDEATFLLHGLSPEIFDTDALDAFSDAFSFASSAGFAAIASTVTVAPALGEEIFFRGLVLRAFERDASAWVAAALSSVLFGALHLDMLQGAGAALVGLYLAFVTLRTGSLWPAVAAHAANNLVCALLARYAPSFAGRVAERGHSVWLVGASLAATAAVIALLVVSTRGEGATCRCRRTSARAS